MITKTVTVEDLLAEVSPQQLQTRMVKCLYYAGYKTLDDLTHARKEDLVKIRNFGPGCIRTLVAALETVGVSLTGVRPRVNRIKLAKHFMEIAEQELSPEQFDRIYDRAMGRLRIP